MLKGDYNPSLGRQEAKENGWQARVRDILEKLA
jgi:hypothetical protein